jgi:ribosomal protein S18
MSFFTPVKALYGLYQAHEASKALKALSKQEDPQYRSATDILNESKANIQRGFSAQEEADFNQSLARSENQRFRTASTFNPNLAGVVNAGINYGNLSALNRFAADSARLRDRKIESLASDITRQDNLNVQDAIRRKREKEMQYAEAYRAGVGNIAGAMDQVDRDAASVTSILTGMPAGGRQASPTGSLTSTGTEMGQEITTPTTGPYSGQYYSPYGSTTSTDPLNGYNPYIQRLNPSQVPSASAAPPDTFAGVPNMWQNIKFGF